MFAGRILMNFFFTMSALFCGQQVLAQNRDWYHVQLKSQDGVVIKVDGQFVGGVYEPFLHERYDLIDNLWFNIHGNSSGITPSDRVEAKVFNYRRPVKASASEGWELDQSAYIRLHWNGTNFTGQWIGIDASGVSTTGMPIYSEGALGNYQYRQEIVVTVYKHNSFYRLMDPISQTPYFKFSFAEVINR